MSLKLVNVSKRHKDKWILRDVSFEVSGGEIFGICTRSDDEKAWLLKAIDGSSGLNGGSIHFEDRDITGLSSTARNFCNPQVGTSSIWGRLFGNGAAVPGREVNYRALSEAIDNADRVLLLNDGFCDVDRFELDELLSATRTAARERGLAVVFASSNFERILQLCDRAAVLVDSEVKQVAEPQEIYEAPESRDVAAITGRNNLFPARRLTSSKAEVPEFHTIDGGHRLFAQHIDRGSLGALNQNVTLAIRPEHISISFGASFPADNLLKAAVTEVKFLGPTTRVTLDADGLELEALVLRLVGLNPGEECMVALPPERIRIFKD